MEIMMFIIFIVTNLFTMLCFGFAFSSSYSYQNGMYLGVHIPADHQNDAAVSDLVTTARRSMKRFQIINTLISIAICFINFASIVVFVMVYCVWIFAYCFFIITLHNTYHKKMYALKMQNGWIIESQQKKIYIDTRVSASTGNAPVSFKWHIAIIIAEIAAFIPYISCSDPHYKVFIYTFFVCSLVISAITLLLHILADRHVRKVYSKDTKLNQIINISMKKYTAIALLIMSLLNGVAWIYIALSTYISGGFSATSYYVYIFIQVITVLGLIIPLFLAQRRKKELLSSDTVPIYVDDDEYWKNGYYYNPYDTHLFVENRMQSGNYSLNYAKKGAWIFSGVTATVIIGALIITFALLIPLVNLNEKIVLADNGVLTISAGGYKSDIDVDDITELKLLSKMPDDSFFKTNGASTNSYDIGRYEGRTFGKCSLYIFDGYSPILMIKTDDTHVFVNSKEDGEIAKLYEKLSN